MPEEIKKIQKQILPILKRAGVLRSSLFGSVARGDAKANSDVDLLVSMKRSADLLDFVRLKSTLEEALQRKVDLVTYGNLSPFIRQQVAKEQIKIL
jgi:hypothetical protein